MVSNMPISLAGKRQTYEKSIPMLSSAKLPKRPTRCALP